MPPGFPDLPVVLVSHRGPVSFRRDQTGARTASRGAGGLVTALTGLASSLPDAVWVCAATTNEDVAVAGEHGDQAVEVTLEPKPRVVGEADPAVGSTSQPGCVKLRLVQFNEQAHDDFYTVIANPLLWFLQGAGPFEDAGDDQGRGLVAAGGPNTRTEWQSSAASNRPRMPGVRPRTTRPGSGSPTVRSRSSRPLAQGRRHAWPAWGGRDGGRPHGRAGAAWPRRSHRRGRRPGR
jgi:hypothetical protein